jgi:hypothetical protein
LKQKIWWQQRWDNRADTISDYGPVIVLPGLERRLSKHTCSRQVPVKG